MPFHAIAKEEIERLRRRARQVHRRRGDGRLRGAGGARGRRRTGGAGGPRDRSAHGRDGDPGPGGGEHRRGGRHVRDGAAGRRELAGDAVNTASRLQSVAPHGGVARRVDVPGHAGRRDPITSSSRLSVKGKAEPLRVWLVDALREDAPGRADEDATPFVGREAERSLPEGAPAQGPAPMFAAARHDRRGTPASGRRASSPTCASRPLRRGEKRKGTAGVASPTASRSRSRRWKGGPRGDRREVLRRPGEAASKLETHLGSLALRAEDIDRPRARLAPPPGLVDAEGLAANREESFAAMKGSWRPRPQGPHRARDRGSPLGGPVHAGVPGSARRAPP